ncbi:hypothetical protein F5Y16DRAFT_393242 [Xylariaceae sp. FL0255]|nr:hypothetical protein F5Y16DRAFT_393242 [Xylariaceae sp. FL0255]
MTLSPVLDRQAVLGRLYRPLPNPFLQDEETVHPWRSTYPFERFQRPLLRIRDDYTGSHPEENDCMMSRAPEMRLDDEESRQASLAGHLDYRNWTPSPYISFTTSKDRIETLTRMRAYRNGGALTLTAIDPDTRLRNGLPILDVEAEMAHYGIEDPYGRNNEYYADEYLCLWQVTPAEIVGHWSWDELERVSNWYSDIIIPAFEEFHTAAAAPVGNNEGWQNAFPRLSLDNNTYYLDRCLKYYVDDLVRNKLDEHGGGGDDDDDDDDWENTDDDEVDDDRVGNRRDEYYGDGYSTGDEVEEANMADDIMRFIEDNW